ncbi:MAG: putative exodeoxyribonuclease 8 [Prokaryotic dsDNA virus sp.]|nr:MAG: putative exodeoxyribonuclease 8 [Prokaryotic dsDNA virus sp.]|tara:strand:- start:22471 stop:23196 length:726 start_codon:yes stop_codon:yes gene_type:complete
MKRNRLSYSALCAFKKSPNHLLKYWEGKTKVTDAMQFGKIIHKLLLEPDLFNDDYAVFEGKIRSGKKWQEFKAANDNKQIIKLSELDDANAIANNAMNNPIFNKLMQNKVHTEKEVRWNHAGVNFKGFVDLESYLDGKTIVCDIKTTTDAGKRFQRDLIYNDYKMQAAMYLENYDNADYYIIAVETTSPYNVQVYKLGLNLIKKGETEYHNLVDKYNNWNGELVGYGDDIIEIEVEEQILI